MWKAFKITFGAVLGVIFAYLFVILIGAVFMGYVAYQTQPQPKHTIYKTDLEAYLRDGTSPAAEEVTPQRYPLVDRPETLTTWVRRRTSL